MLKRFAVAAAGLSVVTNAHMFISSPPPIAGSAPKSPLDASGSNFPCHGIQLPTSGGEPMAAGSSQLLSWELSNGANTAVHGGGSCQISITYETDPVKVKDPKNWHVIYSIESGCPSNTHQNLDGSYQGPSGTYTGALPCSDPKSNGVDCVNQFNFTIPKGVKDGHAILAWTWFNSVGNRELYMNCVNAQLSGGDGSEMDEFPSMFVANMASVNQCPTTQSADLKFPFPGKYVTTKTPSGEAAKTAVTFPMSTPSGEGCASNGAPAGGATSGSADATSAAAPASSTVPPTSTQATDPADTQATDPAESSVITVTTLATITASSVVATTTASSVGDNTPTQATSATPSVPDPSTTGGAGGSSGNTPTSGTCPSGQISCTSPGSIVCIGSNQWGECDIDNCAVPMDLASGTSCSNGAITKRSMRHNRLYG